MDVFDLAAAIRLDTSQYEQGLANSEEKTNNFANGLKNGLSTAAKVGAAALAGASAAVIGLTKSAVSGYAEQQQLVGGVQKLYGNMGMSLDEYAKSVGKSTGEVSKEWEKLETAQNLVLKNAKEAYKTSGMDMNSYLNTATSFSASLISSLGGDTVKAAEQTDVAMRAISDNYNTFGGDMASIEYAFKGFAKQNYTMLDNLKLGYGGTKEEMKRLIEDANEYAKSMGMAGDLSMDSFSDIVTAIDLIQKKQGIAGTTAREAAKTVSGSLGMLKGAWTNLMSGLGDADADIDELVNNVVDSAEVVVDNVLPVVETAISSISKLIEKVAPIILTKLPGLVSRVLPGIVSSAASLVASVAKALPALLGALFESIPGIVNSVMTVDWVGVATQMINSLSNGVTSASAILVQTWQNVMNSIPSNLEETIGGFITQGYTMVYNVIQGIVQGIPELINSGVNMVGMLLNILTTKLPDYLGWGVDMVGEIASGIVKNLPAIMRSMSSGINKLLSLLLESFPKFLEKGIEIVLKIANGIAQNLPAIISSMTVLLSSLISTILNKFPEFVKKGVELVGKLINGINIDIPAIVLSITNLLLQLITTIAKNLPLFLQKGIELVGQIIAGIIKEIPVLLSKIPGIVIEIGTKFTNSFTKYDWKNIGKNIINGVAKGITNAGGVVVDAARNAAKDAFNAAKKFLGIASPSKLFRDKVGKNISLGIAAGIDDDSKEIDVQLRRAVAIKRRMANLEAEARAGAKSISQKISKVDTASISAGGGGGAKAIVQKLEKFTATVQDLIPKSNEAKVVYAEEDVIDTPTLIEDSLSDSSMEDAISKVEVASNKDKDEGNKYITFAPVINVYAKDQDVNELAELVMDRLTFMYDREKVAYGMA